MAEDVALLRSGLLILASHSLAATQAIEELGRAPLVQGLGTALILAIIARVRERDDQIRAQASAEIRAIPLRKQFSVGPESPRVVTALGAAVT